MSAAKQDPDGPLVSETDLQWKDRDETGLFAEPPTTTELGAFLNYLKMYFVYPVPLASVGIGLGALTMYIYSARDAASTIVFDSKMKLFENSSFDFVELFLEVF